MDVIFADIDPIPWGWGLGARLLLTPYYLGDAALRSRSREPQQRVCGS